MIVSRESSPFETSTFRSPKAFWEKDNLSPSPFGTENSPERESPVSPSKRSSIENLKKASRVANSPMFARESKDKYDPSSSPLIERPLTDRPLSDRIQQNPFSRFDSIRKENNPFKSPEKTIHRRMESQTEMNDFMPSNVPSSGTPLKEATSPMKSSLTSNSRYGNPQSAFDPDNGAWSGEDDDMQASTPGGSLRPAKSVTFQTAPPEIKEYEQQTPEPSSEATGSRESSYDSDEYDENSFDRDGSPEEEDSFDASLEDTDKTPVVLPGDWRHASPQTARTDLVDDFDDVFDDADSASPPPSATPNRMLMEPQVTVRSESVTSDDSVRPLPPIPGLTTPHRGRQSSGGLAGAAERASSVQRNLPSPPRPASVSKDEILRMRETNMSLEDRMGLLALQTSLSEESRRVSLGLASPVNLREKRSDDTIQCSAEVDKDELDDLGDLPDFEFPTKISRESILRKVKSDMQNDYIDDEEQVDSGDIYPANGMSYSELAKLDCDVAIPSRETSTHFDEAAAMAIKDEYDSQIDLEDVPEAIFDAEDLDVSLSHAGERQSSVVHHDLRASTESESRYSDSTVDAGMQIQQGAGLGISQDDDDFSTPMEEPVQPQQEREMSLPLLTNFGNDFDFGLQSYMTPPEAAETGPARPVTMNSEDPFSARPHLSPIATQLRASISSEEESVDMPLHEQFEVPVIPERRATIKTNGQLKARPSGSRADLEAMLAMNVEQPVPAIPDQYRADARDQSETADTESIWSQASAAESGESRNDSGVEQEAQNRESRKLDLDFKLPAPEPVSGSGFSLSEEMDRAMETQKVRDHLLSDVFFAAPVQVTQGQKTFTYSVPVSPSKGSSVTAEYIPLSPFVPHFSAGANSSVRLQKGYLMRQNTKVVVASNRNFSNDSMPPKSPNIGSVMEGRASNGTRSAGNSPRKASSEKFIQTEPWNGKMRRKSSRRSSGGRKSYANGPAPPMLGRDSALGVLDEYSTLDDQDEEAERGRLFVKVVGVKDLDLPLPRSEYSCYIP